MTVVPRREAIVFSGKKSFTSLLSFFFTFQMVENYSRGLKMGPLSVRNSFVTFYFFLCSDFLLQTSWKEKKKSSLERKRAETTNACFNETLDKWKWELPFFDASTQENLLMTSNELQTIREVLIYS